MANTRSLGHEIRSLFFIDSLRAQTNLKDTQIEKLVLNRLLDDYGLDTSPEETMSEYFKGRRPVQFDPPDLKVPSWLMAVEMQFPGSSRAFFHPLWDLLYGYLRSKARLLRILVNVNSDSART
jgi:hypothetical protein